MRKQLLFVAIFLVSISACHHGDKQIDTKNIHGLRSVSVQNIDTLIALAVAYVTRPGENKVDLDSAKLLLEKAKRLNDQAKNEIDEGKIYFVYSTAFREGGDTATAHLYLKSCISYFQNKHAYLELGDAFMEEAYYYDISTPDQLAQKVNCYEQASEQFQQTNDKEKLGFALKNLADLEQVRNNYGKALHILFQALDAYKECNYKPLQGVYDLLGATYGSIRDYPNAVKYGLLAVQAAENVGDTSIQMSTIYFRLSLAYTHWLHLSEAVYNIEKAIGVALKYKDQQAAYIILPSLALTEIPAGNWKKALITIKEINSTMMPKSLLDSINLHSAYVFSMVAGKQFSDAGAHATQLKAIIKAHKHDSQNIGLEMAYYAILKYFRDINAFKDLHDYAIDAVALCKRVDPGMGLARSYQALSTSDSARGNFKEALSSYTALTKIKDFDFNQSKTIQFAELEVLYQSDKKNKEIILKQKDIALLKNQNSLQELGLQKERTTRNIIIVSALSLLTIISVGYVIKQRYSNQLDKKQQKIDKQNNTLKELLSGQQKLVKEKEWLVKEIHHRVKNNLQIVISLFNTQSQFLDNPSALEAIKEGRERMQAIALIHQKLYQPEQGSLVKMASYIPEMVNNLKSGFTDTRNITFQLDVDEINLDASQAVPVGLILNEAITNAIKYAFPARRKGIIQVFFKQLDHEKTMLKINDNGVGFSGQFNIDEYGSLGMRLIKLFAEQLEADLHIKNNAGVETTLYFKPQDFNIPGD